MSVSKVNVAVRMPMSEDERRNLMSNLAAEVMQCRSSVGINWGYKVVLLFAAMGMFLLPTVYVLFILSIGYVCYLHAVHDIGMLQAVRGRGIILMFVFYVAPLLAGAIAIFFMIKPLFARRRYRTFKLVLEPSEEPVFFGIVDVLCKALNAPRPSRIMIDCTANASASFGSVWDLFTGKLTLTVGLPLVANLSMKELLGVLAHEFGHFAQGGGTRVTYFISMISEWFERIVYERDEWDDWLEVQKSQSNILIVQLLFAVSQFMVWVSRQLLFCLMIIGNLISSFMIRRMEYDADTYEVRLVGAETYKVTAQKLILLSASSDVAFDSLQKAWRDRRLPDNFITHILRFLSSWPEGKKSEYLKKVSEAKPGIFSTHPSRVQGVTQAFRFQEAKSLNPDGVIRVSAPAAMLFSDLEERSRMATLMLYSSLIGSQLKPEYLVPVEEKAEEARVESEGHEAVWRFFQGAICTIRLCFFTPGTWLEKKRADDVAGEIFGLRQEMRDLSAKIAAEKNELAALMEQFQKCQLTRGAVLVGANKSQIEKAGLIPLESADIASVKWLENQNIKEIEKKAVHIQSAGELGMKRLMLCLSADQTDREQTQPFLQAMAGLKSVYTLVKSMDETLLQLRGAITIIGSKALAENQVEAVLSICHRGISTANEMRSLLGETPYPFAHGSGKRQLRSVLIPTLLPNKQEVGAVGGVMERIVSVYFQIYIQTLSAICSEAQRFESELGLEPLEMPKEANKT